MELINAELACNILCDDAIVAGKHHDAQALPFKVANGRIG